MPILTEPIEDKEFASIEETNSWINNTQKNLIRVPVTGFIKNKASFMDDEYFGDGDYLIRFNDFGFRSFCQNIGFRADQLNLIEEPELASKVLNDLIRQQKVLEKLDKLEFVIDESKNLAVGVVSQTYIGYSHERFLDDVTQYIHALSKDSLKFYKGYSVNSTFMLLFKSESRVGTITGTGGTGKDITQLGLQFKNSVVGTSSVNINYFLHRLICQNGMMVPASSSVNKIFHSGYDDSFRNRLKLRFDEVFRKIDDLQGMLETLGDIPFIPEKIANWQTLSQKVFEVMPGLKQDLCDEFGYVGYEKGLSDTEKTKLKIEHDAFLIEKIPSFFSNDIPTSVFTSRYRDNASLFDFLNVFTEKAQKEKPCKKVQIEEKTGDLAKFISENKKKLM